MKIIYIKAYRCMQYSQLTSRKCSLDKWRVIHYVNKMSIDSSSKKNLEIDLRWLDM